MTQEEEAQFHGAYQHFTWAMLELTTAIADLDVAIEVLKKEGYIGKHVNGNMFEHYRDQIREIHRVLTGEFDRRWGTIIPHDWKLEWKQPEKK